MSTMNPLKFLGGLVLEVGAVIAALAILPGLGGSGLTNFGQGSGLSQHNDRLTPLAASADVIPNQVYFDAQSTRLIDEPQPRTPPAAWQNDYAPAPPVSQQRYVENMLDHNSQRALDTAARLWNQGDRLLPQDLRVRREVPQPNGYTGEPLRDWQQQPRSVYQPHRDAVAEDVLPTAPEVYRQPSHYAPVQNRPLQRYSAQEQPRRMDDRY